MHGYSAFCLSKVAGLTIAITCIIPISAPFVDDNYEGNNINFSDVASDNVEEIVHQTISIPHLNSDKQRNVGFCFIFTCNQRDPYTEQLLCHNDS
jgi:hypothetical protein